MFVCPKGGGARSLSRGSLSRGVSVGGRGVSVRNTPPYGNERAVRILLECIFVWYQFGQALISNHKNKSGKKTNLVSLGKTFIVITPSNG